MSTKRISTLLYFSVIYLVLTSLGVGVIHTLNRKENDIQLTKIGEEMNTALAEGFARSIWPRYSSYLTTVKGTGEQIRKNPETQELNKLTAELASDIPVVKIKIYNLNGLTVYSSNIRQIGESRSDNRGFQSSARFGRPASKISGRDSFVTFDQELTNVAVAETYVPVYGKGRNIEGVFELYSNLTPIVKLADNGHFHLIAVVSAVFAAVYVFILIMLLTVNRASNVQRATNTKLLTELEIVKTKLRESTEKARILEQETELLRSMTARRLKSTTTV